MSEMISDQIFIRLYRRRAYNPVQKYRTSDTKRKRVRSRFLRQSLALKCVVVPRTRAFRSGILAPRCPNLCKRYGKFVTRLKVPTCRTFCPGEPRSDTSIIILRLENARRLELVASRRKQFNSFERCTPYKYERSRRVYRSSLSTRRTLLLGGTKITHRVPRLRAKKKLPNRGGEFQRVVS